MLIVDRELFSKLLSEVGQVDTLPAVGIMIDMRPCNSPCVFAGMRYLLDVIPQLGSVEIPSASGHIFCGLDFQRQRWRFIIEWDLHIGIDGI